MFLSFDYGCNTRFCTFSLKYPSRVRSGAGIMALLWLERRRVDVRFAVQLLVMKI